MFPPELHTSAQFSSLECFMLRLSPEEMERLFSFFHVKSVIALSKTSSYMHGVYLWYCKTVWDPTPRYKQWFIHVSAFKRLLRRCNAVVSGSFALQFFDRTRYPGSDMDIFLRSAGVDDICGWMTTQGYQYIEDQNDYKYDDIPYRLHSEKAVMNCSSFDNALLGVYTYQKIIASEAGCIEILRVQIIVVDVDPVEHILFDFHSTGVMNFLTADEALSIFPFSTFVERIFFISKTRDEPPERFVGWTTKYTDRGFTIIGAGSCVPHRPLPMTDRFVSDSQCWRIQFQAGRFFERGYYGLLGSNVPFDVLPITTGLVAGNSYIRIAEPYVWSTLMAKVAEVVQGQ